jgi:hypothetical protein
MKRLAMSLLALSAAAAGCSMMKEDPASREVEQKAQEVEFQAKESQTRSALAGIESALKAFVDTEKRIPESLDELVPKYLAEIPVVEIGVRGYHDTNAVKIYPSSILVQGSIDGSKLKDTGRWGYVHTDNRVVVFIDCTEKSSRGIPWYQERGVY